MDRLNSCKIRDCGNPIQDRTGRYAKLCTTHKAEQQARAPQAVPPPGRKGLSAEVRDLASLAKQVERAAAKLAALPTPAKERKRLLDATRAVQNDLGLDALTELADATKAFQRLQPARDKKAREFDTVRRELRDRLQAMLVKVDRAGFEHDQERQAA